jgi:hypothetical protein
MSLLRRYLALLALLAIAGCAQTPTISSTPYVPPPESQLLSTLVVFRANAIPTAVYARIFVDDTHVATLPDQMHTWVQVKPGTRTVSVKFPPLTGESGALYSGTFEAGQTYYLRYHGTSPTMMPIVGAGGAIVGSLSRGSYSRTLTSLPKRAAEEEMSNMRLTFTPAVVVE